jgi:hypothetical protein
VNGGKKTENNLDCKLPSLIPFLPKKKKKNTYIFLQRRRRVVITSRLFSPFFSLHFFVFNFCVLFFTRYCRRALSICADVVLSPPGFPASVSRSRRRTMFN